MICIQNSSNSAGNELQKDILSRNYFISEYGITCTYYVFETKRVEYLDHQKQYVDVAPAELLDDCARRFRSLLEHLCFNNVLDPTNGV